MHINVVNYYLQLSASVHVNAIFRCLQNGQLSHIVLLLIINAAIHCHVIVVSINHHLTADVQQNGHIDQNAAAQQPISSSNHCRSQGGNLLGEKGMKLRWRTTD